MKGSQSNREYTSPEVTEFGSVEQITEKLNKQGLKPDQYTEATNGVVVGSTQPAK
ncbi:putative RiPP precursor [Candidatus Halobonum tyrrellensis]|uniref:putative RiPP precursor n=1 Tax=Candidatus Halobonum tyrrellensis TaxID=1431545 RepID=UPI00126879DB|nr:putative RiPP precursor [Candidatus Halobonum tyrrellensis]